MRPRLLLFVLLALVAAACSDDESIPGSTTAAPGSMASSTTTVPANGSTSTAGSTPTTTAVPPPPLDAFEIDVELVADGFDQPVFVTSRPGDDRLFVVAKTGQLIALDLATGAETVVLDLAGQVSGQSEQGLLGVAFHPDDGDRLVVHYTDSGGSTVLEEYLVLGGIADPESRRLLFTTPQPAPNHNGGMIAFGPDGYLYVALGDGGAANDRYANGQNPFTPLGAILRLDLAGDPYAIPADNPFADGADGAPEVWAWGLRNPWRFAFDGSDLWVADVGQDAWEEIDLLSADRPGDNAGWPVLEGTHCFQTSSCDPAPYLAPIVEYAHEGGRCSVTGGAVYRGEAIPQLVGTYLYGDYCTGEVWGLRPGDAIEQRLFTDLDDVHLPRLVALTSFGVGPDGELYAMQATGQIWRFVLSS